MGAGVRHTRRVGVTMAARWGTRGHLLQQSCLWQLFPDKWCLVWWRSLNESGGGCRSGEGSACLKDALGEEGQKDIGRVPWLSQVAPCRTHISLPGQGHPAVPSQLCLLESRATRTRCHCWGRDEGALFGRGADEGFWGPQGLWNCRSWRSLDVGPCFCHTCAL